MFCSECGKKIQDDMKFCPYCGGKIVNLEQLEEQLKEEKVEEKIEKTQVQEQNQVPNHVPNYNLYQNTETAPSGQIEKGKKNPLIWVVVALVGIIVILLIGIAVRGNSNQKSETKNDSLTYDEAHSKDDNSGTNSDGETTGKKPNYNVFDSTTEKKPNYNNFDATTEAKETATTRVSYSRIITDIIMTIEGYSNYNPNQSQTPLAVCGDVDKDGSLELLAVYETTDYKVCYELWYLNEYGADKISSGEVFKEVGGNSGKVGFAKGNGRTYFVRSFCAPEGDNFLNVAEFHLFDDMGGSFTDDGTVLFEASGSYENMENGSYRVNGSSVGKSAYDSEYDAFRWEYTVDYNKGVEAGVVSFDELLQSAFSFD